MVTTATNYSHIVNAYKQSKLLPSWHPDKVLGCGLEGASRTGKDWDKCVFVCQYVATFTGKKINLFRDYFSTLKKTTYNTLKQVWKLFGYDTSVFNKTASDIHFRGNVISFLGINDNPDKILGLESDLALIGEAITLNQEHVNQIIQRTNDFFVFDYNPTASADHWIFKKEHDPSYLLHRTTLFDNPYVPVNAARKIISYAHTDNPRYDLVRGFLETNKNRKIKTPFHSYLEIVGKDEASWYKLCETNVELNSADLYNWEVYGLGKRAVGEDIIFPRWKLYSDKEIPNPKLSDWGTIFGGDFGFATDPTALVEIHKFGNDVFLRERIYETGLLNAHIAQKVIENGWNKNISVWDSADGFKSVMELQREGLYYAVGAVKGVGSVEYGIQYMKKFNLHIHEESINLRSEMAAYKWAKDKSGNYKRNTLKQRVPIQNVKDHAIDASRYGMNYFNAALKAEASED